MQLATQQLTTLKTAIAAETDAAFVAYRQANNEQGMSDWYNVASTFYVWLSSVTRDAVTVEGFDWTQVDNLTTGQARIWDLLFDTQTKSINPGEPGKRAAIGETWKGTAAKLAVGVFVLGKCKRLALKGERLFATGTGTEASPGVAIVEGQMTPQNISDALRS